MITHRLGDPAVVYASFGRETLQRALGYLGAVEQVETGVLSRSRVTAQARVRGTAPHPYRVSLEAFDDGGASDAVLIESWCSCPVVHQCKHGAALAFRLGQGGGGSDTSPSSPPDWRRRLEGVLDVLAASAPPVDRSTALALRFTHDQSASGSRPTIRVRPMRAGRRGWVQRGADWHELVGLPAQRELDPRQLGALLMLKNALGSQHWYQGVDRSLSDFGPQVVRLLREAATTGVVLYAAAPLTDVRLLEDPVDASVDLVADGDALELRLAVAHDGRIRPVSEVLLLGGPAHSVASVDDDVLTLAALARPVPSGLLDTVGRGAPVRIPVAETAELPAYLRRLRRHVPVISSDRSAPVPEAVSPRLRVTVTWRTAAHAEVAWCWVYADSSVDERCAVGSLDDLGGLRDPLAEQRLLAALGRLDTTDREVSGADTVSLALLELPAWRELEASEGLEVVELDRPDFREAAEAPEITVDLVEPEEVPGHTDWLDLEVMVTVEGERVPLPDVLEALTLGQEFLVLPSGLYLPTDLPELARLAQTVRAAAELRERDRDARDDRIRVGRDDLGVLAELGDHGLVAPGAQPWIERARALRDLVDLPRPEPTGLTTELRSYQYDGFRWLAFLWEHGLGGILADDMGLGKTLQVLALLTHTRASGAGDPFLVVAPTSVVSAWAEQAARHAPDLRVRTVAATGRRRTESIADLAAGADLVVTSYTLLRLDDTEYAAVEWGALVLDEAQQIKNHRSQAHRAISALRAPFRLAVSGTPFENRLLELWSLLAVVSPGLYPTQRGFTQHVVRPVEQLGDATALDRFTRRIKPFVLRRTKDLVAGDLPTKQEQVLDVELGARHRRLYDSHLTKERQRILGLLDDFDENRVAILAALTRLRQLSLDPALVDPAHEGVGSAKIDVLVEHLLELAAEGHRALVFSTFTGFLRRVGDRLAERGIEHAYLDGSTHDRGAVIERFRSGTAPAFLISLKAGGVGLTLTEADYVFVLDPWWNPAAEAQAVDRAHRIGQQRTVMVYRLVSRDTIEDKVVALKERKAALFARVLDGETQMSETITAADIRGLLED